MSVDLKDYPYIRVELASAPATTNRDPVPLTAEDIHALPGVGDSVDALMKFFEAHEFAPRVYLDIAAVLICLCVESDEIKDLDGIKTKADGLVDLLASEADLLHLNAQAIEPQPAKDVVKVKVCFPLLKALASADTQSPLRAELFQTDGSRRPLPIPDIAEMSSVRRRAADTMEIDSKIKGLVRGDSENENELIIAGDTHVRLTGTSPYLWTEIRLLLDWPHRLIGKLVRTLNSQKWTVADNTRIEAQSVTDDTPIAEQYELHLPERSD